MFDKLYRFAANMNWRLIFDLNSLIRKKDGSWDPSNAVELIKTVDSHNYSIDYELGNEPDLYPTHRNLTIEPKQLASDFKTLKEILLNITMVILSYMVLTWQHLVVMDTSTSFSLMSKRVFWMQ